MDPILFIYLKDELDDMKEEGYSFEVLNANHHEIQVLPIDMTYFTVASKD